MFSWFVAVWASAGEVDNAEMCRWRAALAAQGQPPLAIVSAAFLR
jgi:hypothetical protein